MNVGKSIKIALVKHDKDQKWLAKKLGVVPQHVSRLATTPTARSSTIERLAEIFKMPESEFIALGE